MSLTKCKVGCQLVAQFPNGIDDALSVYFKHTKEDEVTVAQLRPRVSWLAKNYPGMTAFTVYEESS
ncbi:hypothetical protein KJ359_005572 [Pestalotiopsis sp. 9143b]|nr:hypothetical protein KJ359_005572 [Pestalotiopsis sp. 9143b]